VLRATLFALLFTISVGAQETGAPTVTLEQTRTLQVFDLTIENLALRIELAKREKAEFLNSLQKSGYTLQRREDGLWVYIPIPKQGQN
jgi:hypothetical protein